MTHHLAIGSVLSLDSRACFTTTSMQTLLQRQQRCLSKTTQRCSKNLTEQTLGQLPIPTKTTWNNSDQPSARTHQPKHPISLLLASLPSRGQLSPAQSWRMGHTDAMVSAKHVNRTVIVQRSTCYLLRLKVQILHTRGSWPYY